MTERAMTSAERQKLRRDRLREQGFTQTMVWVHSDDQARLDAFLDTLARPEPYHADRHHE